MFLGPTGVGKTELARALAEFLFDDERALVRLDMSEFMEKHSVARLIGAPPGYVGYEEGGYLTEAVRRRPYTVILFDEIEKAHGDVFNVLLQVLDEGRLTDGQGRTVDFKNALVIMTSNLGSQFILEDQDEGTIREKVQELLKTAFRPEFLNRIDETVIFHRLSLGEIKQIVEIQLRVLQRRLAGRKLEVEIGDRAKELLARQGFDPLYGARPLKRALQRLVQDPLARGVLEGEFREGDRIRVEAAGGEITLERMEAPPRPRVERGRGEQPIPVPNASRLDAPGSIAAFRDPRDFELTGVGGFSNLPHAVDCLTEEGRRAWSVADGRGQGL